MDGLGAHLRLKLVQILFPALVVLFLRQQLHGFQIGHARVDHHIGLEIQHPLYLAQGHVQQQAHARGERFQIPDVRHRAGQFDMAHALAAFFGQGDFHPAFFAFDPAVFQALVLAAQALVILGGAENLRAKQAIPLRLESAVVDGFRLLDLAHGPSANLLGRHQPDGDVVKFANLVLLLKQFQ